MKIGGKGARVAAIAWMAVALQACGPSTEYVLSVLPGLYNDGSGLTGLAALVTLRGRDGKGPAEGAEATLLADSTLLKSQHLGGGEASATNVFLWPDVPASPGSRFTLRVTVPGLENHSQEIEVPDRALLAPPAVDVSSDAARLSWTAIPGAVSYASDAGQRFS